MGVGVVRQPMFTWIIVNLAAVRWIDAYLNLISALVVTPVAQYESSVTNSGTYLMAYSSYALAECSYT